MGIKWRGTPIFFDFLISRIMARCLFLELRKYHNVVCIFVDKFAGSNVKLRKIDCLS